MIIGDGRRSVGRYNREDFSPTAHEQALIGIVAELSSKAVIDGRFLTKVLNRHPRGEGRTFSKSELIRGVETLAARHGWDAKSLVKKLRMKPVRTQSGVAPVTVLTKPFPCPGRCIFCPSDVQMPKSYLSMEPGAQRAGQLRFDPYAQTRARLIAFLRNGHPIDKVELIILGGTWSAYSEDYQRWFIRRCFDAMNEPFDGELDMPRPESRLFDFDELIAEPGRYNEIVGGFLKRRDQWAPVEEAATWAEVEAAQVVNETSRARSVGLVVETRPDHVDVAEATRLRRLGVTKVQLGYQSTDDRILELNQRGHDVEASRRATTLLRRFGFKIHGHFMPNLLGATPESDREGFERLYSDPGLCPDELKLYPCSLIETAELMQYYRRGEWRPYEEVELLDLLTDCLALVPRWCRVTRVIRDIPSHDIYAGNKQSNLREHTTERAKEKGLALLDIRAREIGARAIDGALVLKETEYQTGAGKEIFLELVTREDRIAGFLRLSLPAEAAPLGELEGAALIRELHVYGDAVPIGEHSGHAQHQGLGRQLLERATVLAEAAGHSTLAVISAIGTRPYYRRAGFSDGALYQHLSSSTRAEERR